MNIYSNARNKLLLIHKKIEEGEYFHQNYSLKQFEEVKNNFKLKKSKNKKRQRKLKLNITYPIQPTPITINNFFISTKGLFNEISEIHLGFESFFKSKNSEYFTNSDRTILIRKSNHWGFRIKNCDWHLKGYGLVSCGRFSKENQNSFKIGIIKYSDLKVNRR